MKNLTQTRRFRRSAFTLVELLVVIAIIGVLAALIFPALRLAKAAAARGKAHAELKQIESAIESYKDKLGFYPPDNPDTNAHDQLFYELQGTFLTNSGGVTVFLTLDGREAIRANAVSNAFGAGVAGFVNCTKPGAADDTKAAEKFLRGLRPDQYGFATSNTVRYGILVCPVPGIAGTGAQDLNPWRYNSSNPTHNPKSYDLWVDIVAGGKTNRISNWNKRFENIN